MCFSSVCRGKTIPSGQCSPISSSSYAKAESMVFFCFGGGEPLHNVHFIFSHSRVGQPLPSVQSLTFHSLLDILAACFTNSNLKAVLLNPSDVLSIVRCSCHLVPGSFIPILHSGPFESLFTSIHSFGALLIMMFLLCPLCHATPARQVILLQVAANFFQDPQFLRVRSFVFWWCPMGSHSPPAGFTVACSLGTSSCSVLDSISSEVGSLHSRCAFVISWHCDLHLLLGYVHLGDESFHFFFIGFHFCLPFFSVSFHSGG